MQHRTRWASAAAAGAVVLALLPGPGAAQPAAAAPADVTVPAAPRLAFTSDRDEAGQWEITRSRSGAADRFSGVPVLPDGVRQPGPVHAGETSYTRADRDGGITLSAYVSTADGAGGDVYVTGLPGTEAPVRVTCDDAVETHPVVSPDGTSVAYASNVSGDFRIWVVRPVDGEVACEAMPRSRVTAGPGQDLWPAWTPTGSLVFGSTRDDPLGDLYVQDVPAEGPPAPAARLTDDPGADTQPTVGSAPPIESPVVAFTTTRFRPDGSVAFVALPVAPGARVPAARSAWAADPPQSAEPVLAPDGTALAYTGTAADPHGDVWVGSLGALGTVTGADPVAALPGIAESHPAWAEGFRSRDDATDTTFARLVVTRRSLDAGVADVVTADGSGRRTVAAATSGGDPPAGTRDPAMPAYSPDGTRIAYSREIVPLPGTGDHGRELVVARADGAEVAVPADGRRPGDVDLHPAWSPDGTRIAFVRTLDVGEGYLRPRAWVADLRTGEARVAGPDPPSGEIYHDETVSWSPDGTRLAIGRHVLVQPDLAVTLTAEPPALPVGGTTTLTATVRNTGRGTAPETTLGVGVDAGLTVVTAPPPCTITREGTWVDCRLGTLRADVARTFAITVRADRGGTHTVTASGSTGSVDLDPGNNSATATVEVTGGGVDILPPPPPGTPPPPPPGTTPPPGGPPPTPGGGRPFTASVLVVPVITTSPPVVTVGGAVRLAVTLAGSGLAVGASVRLTVRLPQGLVVTAVAEGCLVLGQDVTCGWDPVPPDGLPTVVIEARVTVAGLLAVTATVAVGLPDGTSNALSATVALVVVIGLPVPLPALPPLLPPGLVPPVPPVVPPGLLPVPSPDLTPVPTPSASPPPPGTALPLPLGGTRPPQGPPPFAAPQVWTVDAGTGVGAVLRAPAAVCSEDPCAPVPVSGRSPAWSPDGLRIAYDDGGAVRIAVLVDADRNGAADVPESAGRIAAVTGFDADGRPTPSRGVLSVAEDPAWAPDGSALAVAGQPAGQPDQRGIYTLRPDGTGLRTLTQERGPETEPAWQPYAGLAVTLTAEPPQFAPQGTTTLTATLTATGPAPAADTTLTVLVPPGLGVPAAPEGCSVTGGTVVCPFGTVLPGTTRMVDVVAVGDVAGTYTVTATVTTGTPDAVATDNTATVQVFVVLPGSAVGSDLVVTLTPAAAPTYVGATNEVVTVTVTNRGPEASGDSTLQTTYPPIVAPKGEPPCVAGGPPCPIGPLAVGQTRTLTAALAVTEPGSGTITATVTGTSADPDLATNSVSVPLTVLRPTLRLLPPVGEPGFVTLAYGQNLPPGDRVTVAWDPGITAVPGPFIVGPDGTLRAQVLVVRRDELGVRVLVVTSDAGAFGALHADMLVVPRTASVSVPTMIGRQPPYLGRD